MITITIPTKNRPDRLGACLRSIDFADVAVRIGVSGNREVFNAGAMAGGIAVKDIFVLFLEGYPVPVQTRLASESNEDSHILPVSDDILFSPGAILSAHNALMQYFPDSDGCVGLNVSNLPDADRCPYAYMLVGSKFFNKRLGRRLFYFEYQHFFADMELGEYADKLGKFISCPEATLVHFHPSAGYVADQTHLTGRQEKWAHDYGVYCRRKTK